MSLSLQALIKVRKELAMLACGRPTLLQVAANVYEEECLWKSEEAQRQQSTIARHPQKDQQDAAQPQQQSFARKNASKSKDSQHAASAAKSLFQFNDNSSAIAVDADGGESEQAKSSDVERSGAPEKSRYGRVKRKVPRLSDMPPPKKKAKKKKTEAVLHEDPMQKDNKGYPKLCEYGCGKLLNTFRSKPGHEKACPIKKSLSRAKECAPAQRKAKERAQERISDDADSKIVEDEADKDTVSQSKESTAVENANEASTSQRQFVVEEATAAAQNLAQSIKFDEEDDVDKDDETQSDETAVESSEEEQPPRIIIDQDTGEKRIENISLYRSV